jgi:hypothetical protein
MRFSLSEKTNNENQPPLMNWRTVVLFNKKEFVVIGRKITLHPWNNEWVYSLHST